MVSEMGPRTANDVVDLFISTCSSKGLFYLLYQLQALTWGITDLLYVSQIEYQLISEGGLYLFSSKNLTFNNDDLLLIKPLRTHLIEFWIKTQNFSR